MPQVIRVLHLEDDDNDAALIVAVMQRAGLECEAHRVDTREDYAAALELGGFDLILADHYLPSFDGLAALDMARARRPDVPFLFVSGFIGEEVALDSLKNGATDYVFKHNLARLVPAVRRALQESRERRERAEAQAALQEREAILSSFYDAAPFMMGILELRRDEVLHLSANAATAEFVGTTPEEIRFRPMSALGIPPEMLRHGIQQLQVARSEGRPVEFEQNYTRKGRSRCLSITVTSLATAPDQPPRFCYVAEDITEKRQLEQQFFRAQRLESVGTLASGLAHDLNNVLAPILMALRLFRPKLKDREDQELLASVESSARRGADIIRQVLTFARGVEGAPRPLELKPLVNDLASMLRDALPRTVEIETSVPDGTWRVAGNATQIYQVLMNLGLNARDAMSAGGRLVIAAANVELTEAQARCQPGARPGPYVVLSVTDTGTGIAPETIDKIFDPFYTTKEIGKGTGLGLWSVLTIVQGHGGFVTVKSQPGCGTRFDVHLPAALAAAEPGGEPSPHALERGRGQWILVADDDATVRQVTRATLEGHGYRVVTAASRTESLARFRERHGEIQLILTDMLMPPAEGAGLLQTFRQLVPGQRIIAMSGLLEKVPGSPAESAGVVLLQKPFAAEPLLRLVEMLARTPVTSRSP